MIFSESVSPQTLFASGDHFILARYQIIQAARRVRAPLFSAEKFDVIKLSRLVNQVATDNGCVAKVTGFTGKGDICLSNGKILAKDFGHIASGYYIKSWSGQSKTVDRVLVTEGAESFRAANLEQFYVSCTRGREGARVYTDDKDGLRERIVHSGQRGSAMELLAGQVAVNTRPRDVKERAMKDRDRLRKRVAYRRKHEAVAETIRDRIAAGPGKRRGEWHEKLQWQRQGPDYGR